MNAKAEELGLTHTHFANAHGLPDPAQRSTAEDLARLIGACSRTTRRRVRSWAAPRFVYRGRVYSRRIPLFQDPGGVQALKTGLHARGGLQPGHLRVEVAGQHFVLIVLGSQTRSLSFRDAKSAPPLRLLRDRPRGRAPPGAGPARSSASARRAPRRPSERRPRARLPGAG